MKFKVQKNEEYSRLMRDIGSIERVDKDDPTGTNIELPPWNDPEKLKKGQIFGLFNLHSFIAATFSSLMAIASIPSILIVLKSTKKSSTVASAYRRFKMNGFHSKIWSSGPIEPGSRAWKSFEVVRTMHVFINSKAEKTGSQLITQKDMAITQFLYIGFQCSGCYGIVGTDEELENFNHFSRMIGYMLGIKDEFNCCGPTYAETLARVEAIKDDFMRPNFMNPTKEYLDYAKIALDGMWYSDPTLHFDSVLWQVKRVLRIPGYYYFESERPPNEEPGSNMKILSKLSFNTRFRIFLDMIYYEILSKFIVIRFMMTIFRFSFALLEIFPILLIISFGKKFARTEKKRFKENMAKLQ